MRSSVRSCATRPSTSAMRQYELVAAKPAPQATEFDGMVARIYRDNVVALEASPPGPPQRIDGYTIGAVTVLEGPGPHLGEMHPDGDEFLHVVRGTMELVLDDGDEDSIGTETVVVLRAGDAYVVPRGVWHRVIAVEPSYLVHVTPGPHGPARPLR
jgi:quercetin dioxygenase-like cupin family protein